MQEKYFIGLLLPIKITNQIDIWRKKFYPFGYNMVPVHITIIPPFIPSVKEEVLSNKIEQILSNYSTFNISINNFGHFTHQSSVYFAKIDTSPDLSSLHSWLLPELQILSASAIPVYNSFTPHITIANRLSRAELTHIQCELKDQSITSDVKIEELVLFKKSLTAPYAPACRYTLDKKDILRYHPKADLGNEWSAAKANHP